MRIKILKWLDALIGKPLCLVLGFFNRAPKAAAVPRLRRVLFLRPGGVGDFLYLLPALKIFKKHYPGVKIDVAAEKRNQPARDLTDAIDRVITYDANPVAFIFKLRQGNYDVVIDSEQLHHFSAVFAYLTGAKVRIGFNTVPPRNRLYTHLIDYRLEGQEAREFLRLLEPLGIKDEEPAPAASISRAKIDKVPLPVALARFKTVVIVAPRGETKYRYWSPQKYAAVIRHLIQKPGQGVVLVGGRSEKKLAKEIMAQVPDPRRQVLSLAGKTSFLQLARILLTGDLFIGCDSGVSILAALLAVKTITLFGATDERKWAIESPEHRVVRRRLPCAPCYVLGSYKSCKNIDCMKNLTAEDVIAAIRAIF